MWLRSEIRLRNTLLDRPAPIRENHVRLGRSTAILSDVRVSPYFRGPKGAARVWLFLLSLAILMVAIPVLAEFNWGGGFLIFGGALGLIALLGGLFMAHPPEPGKAICTPSGKCLRLSAG